MTTQSTSVTWSDSVIARLASNKTFIARNAVNEDTCWDYSRLLRFLETSALPVSEVVLLDHGEGTQAVADSLGVFAHPPALVDSISGSETLRILGVNRFDNQLAQLCASFGSAIRKRTSANLYITPSKSQGSILHTDPHDVATIQLLGEKYWQLPSGLENQIEQIDTSDGHPVARARTGDLLFMPKGTEHAAFTQQDISVHLTIGILDSEDFDVPKHT